MTREGLIAIGLAWFLAVVLWVCFFDRSFSHVWMAPSVFKQTALHCWRLRLHVRLSRFLDRVASAARTWNLPTRETSLKFKTAHCPVPSSSVSSSFQPPPVL